MRQKKTTFSWIVALVFSKPDLAEAPMLAAVSLKVSMAFFAACIFLFFTINKLFKFSVSIISMVRGKETVFRYI